MTVYKPTDHRVLLQWLIGLSLMLLGAYIAWSERLFHQLISSDQSHLSAIILLIFVLVNSHVAWVVFRLSVERNQTDVVRQSLQQTVELQLADRQQLRNGNELLTPSHAVRHLRNLLMRLGNPSASEDRTQLQSQLLHVLEQRVGSSFRFGWILSDLMIKLGLVGTVIGFVIMLGSVATLEQYDIQTMQDLLRSMSGGMRVALFTTLTGLSCGLLLGLQYQFIDHHAQALIADIEELTEIYVLPALLNSPVIIKGSD